MPESLPLPFSNKSPERLMEEREEKRPRQYAMDIFRRYPEHERMAAVDRKVPPHLRNHVRELLRDWAMREKHLRGQA